MKLNVWGPIVVLPVMVLLSGCGFDGSPIFSDTANHKINMGGSTEDTLPLSVQVKQALRKNPQTALTQIQVSSASEDTVKLAGSVDNDAIRQEAERVAGQVPGVRFVINSLGIR